VILRPEDLKHLLDHLEIVISHSSNTLNHALHVSMTALLLEIFNFLPKLLRDLSRGGGCMKSLRQAIIRKELLLVSLRLLLDVKLLINDIH